MLRQPPHLLVTTPESLYLLVTAERSREMLRGVHTVIVDEIHAVARDKRGSHLALTLERLEALCDQRPARIGLSATQRPDRDGVAAAGRRRPRALRGRRHAALRGGRRGAPAPARPRHRAAGGRARGGGLERAGRRGARRHRGAREVPPHHPGVREHATHSPNGWPGSWGSASARRAWPPITGACRGSAGCGWRASCGPGSCGRWSPPRPSSWASTSGRWSWCARSARPAASPPSSSAWAARVTSWAAFRRGASIPSPATSWWSARRCCAAWASGRLDALHPPVAPLDILAQQIVAACAAEAWSEDDAVRAGASRRALREPHAPGLRRRGGAARRGHHHRPRTAGRLPAPRPGERRAARSPRARASRPSRPAARFPRPPTTGCWRATTTPSSARVGEDFAIESMVGDIFLLGSTSWRIRRVESGVVRVVDAQGAPSTVPFWVGEAPARTEELSNEVSVLRERVERLLEQDDEAGASRLPRARVPGAAGGRRPDRRLPRGGPDGAGGAAHPAAARLRALLRRVGRHAARGALALRRSREPRPRARPAQEVLRQLRLRAPGGRQRRRHRALPRAAAQLPAGERRALPEVAERARDAAQGGAAVAHVRRALALEPESLAGGAALPGRAPQPAADPAHGGRRPDGRGLPGAGRLPGERRRPASRFPTTRWCGRPCATASTRGWTRIGCSGCWRTSRRARWRCTSSTPPSRRRSPTRS